MPSGLTSRFYLAGVPPGLTFEVASIKPVAPDDGLEWKAGFRRAAGGARIGCVGQVNVDNQDGFIGEAHFEGHNGFWGTGTGAMVTLEFHVYGTTTVNGSDCEVDQCMVVLIATTVWRGFTRPDYVNVTYAWRRATADPVNVALSVPADMAGLPDDLYFILGVSGQNGREVGMNTMTVWTDMSTDGSIALTAAEEVLRGIFWAHEKLFGWAVGQLFRSFAGCT